MWFDDSANMDNSSPLVLNDGNQHSDATPVSVATPVTICQGDQPAFSSPSPAVVAEEEERAHRARKPGEAPIKWEFVVKDQTRKTLNLSFVTDADRLRVQKTNGDDAGAGTAGDENGRAVETTNDDEPKPKKLRGMNKNRRTMMQERNNERLGIRLCSKFAGSFGLDEHKEKIEGCTHGENCKFSHDVDAYLETQPPYLDQECYIYSTYGFCGYGLRCKFAPSHMHPDTHHNLLDESKFLKEGPKFNESYKNYLPNEVKFALRKKKYDFSALEETMGPASLEEKQWKKVDFAGKLYLAPLTTVGNLPFRRVCKEYV